MDSTDKFPLVDGKCPVCETQIEHVIDGVRVRLVIHDADFCRASAQRHTRTMRRALEEAYEARAFAQHRESFYRHAFAVALNELARLGGSHPDVCRATIERKVRQEMDAAKESLAIAAAMALRGDLAPR